MASSATAQVEIARLTGLLYRVATEQELAEAMHVVEAPVVARQSMLDFSPRPCAMNGAQARDDQASASGEKVLLDIAPRG